MPQWRKSIARWQAHWRQKAKIIKEGAAGISMLVMFRRQRITRSGAQVDGSGGRNSWSQHWAEFRGKTAGWRYAWYEFKTG